MKYTDGNTYDSKNAYLACYTRANANANANANNPSPLPSQEEALKQALDIRKFETDLYWKRATYFWAFIASAFIAYFSVANKKLAWLPVSKNEALFIIAVFGLFLSFCWFCINKASQYWIRNWEHQVELLEDEIIGPLYKRNIVNNEAGCWLKRMILRPYKHSASRINQLLSFGVVILWVYIVLLSGCRFLYPLFACFFTWLSFSNILTAVAAIIFILLFVVLFKCCNHVPKDKKSESPSKRKSETTWTVEEREII